MHTPLSLNLRQWSSIGVVTHSLTVSMPYTRYVCVVVVGGGCELWGHHSHLVQQPVANSSGCSGVIGHLLKLSGLSQTPCCSRLTPVTTAADPLPVVGLGRLVGCTGGCYHNPRRGDGGGLGLGEGEGV